MKRIALMVLLVSLGLAQALAQNTGVVWRSYRSGATAVSQTADERVIQNQGGFDTYWKEIAGDVNAPKDVDFATEFLVAVRLGRRPSGGYRVVIRSIERTLPGQITITYEERKPAPGSPTIAMMTSPYDIVRVDRKTAVGGFVFKKREAFDNVGGPTSGLLGWRTYQCDVVGGGSSEFTRVIRDQREWETYWRTIDAGRAPQDVDWTQEMIVAIHLGTRPTTGYDVLIDSIDAIPGGFAVCFVEKAPSADQKVRRSPTSPFVILRVPRLQGSIQFRKRVWRSDG